MFNVSISIEQNRVLGEFIADSYFFEPSKYDYAFYLYKDGKTIDTKWYADIMSVNFSVEDATGIFYIKVFVRDLESGNKRTFNSEKITINS